MMLGALARARAEQEPQLVTLVGVPGIGKSRLVSGAVAGGRRRSGADLLAPGPLLPYGDGVAYWALGEMVKAQAGILETDGVDEAQAKLGGGRPRHDRGRDRGATGSSGTSARSSGWRAKPTARAAGGESFAAWRRFFEALAEREPAVLVFEDLHWADDGLLDFVDQLRRAAHRRASPCRRAPHDPNCSSAGRAGAGASGTR